MDITLYFLNIKQNDWGKVLFKIDGRNLDTTKMFLSK